MNKNTLKKALVAFVAAMTMVAATVPAYADENPTGSITITNKDTADHTYYALQVFSGTYSSNGNVLTDIEWGNGVVPVTLLPALKADSTIGSSFTDCTTASDVAAVLAEQNNDTTFVKTFAKIALKNADSVNAIAETTNDKFTGLADGYYLVFEDADELDDSAYAAMTALILRVVGGEDVPVEAKSYVPTLTKNILEDGTKKNVSDYNIGDEITFVLEATLSDINDYETYKLVFNDTYDAGLTFNAITSVKVGDTTLTTEQYTKADVTNGFNLTIADVKTYGATNGTKVTVTYTAKLNENAVIGGNGNENECDLSFSNNPNAEGEGKTPKDNAKVYSFELDVNKVNETGSALAGAKFVLSRNNVSDATEYAVVDNNNKLIGWTTTEANATVFTTLDDGKIFVKGLDAGTYSLIEKEAPAGYNKLTDPITVEIKATYDDTTLTLTTLEATNSKSVDKATGIVTYEVENKSGNSLPTTGGIGTTIFFVTGGVIVAGAAVVLIIKKRINNVD